MIIPLHEFFVRCGTTAMGTETSCLPPPSRTVKVKAVAFNALAASDAVANSTSIDPSRSLSQRRTLPSRSHPSFRWKGERELSCFSLEENTRIRGVGDEVEEGSRTPIR